MTELTIPEALDQGYQFYGYEGREWQNLNDLSDLDPDDEDLEAGELRLFEKEPQYRSISADSICDLVTDNIMDSDDFADDTGTIPDALKDGVPWEEFAEKINAVLKETPYYRLTDVKLKP